VYNILAINNNKLISRYLEDKTVKVYLKYKDGNWKDITSYVTNIEIQEDLQYNGYSLANKIGIALINTNGEFSPAKVGVPFNETLTGSSRTFLNTKFPIKVEVTANGTTYTIFRGYANKVKDDGLKATIEAFDIFYLLSRKRFTKQLNIVRKTPKDAIDSLLSDGGFFAKWQADFGSGITVNYSPSTQVDDILLVADAKTYLEAINQILSHIGGVMTYRPITNTIEVVIPADSNFTEPTAYITLSTDNINSYAIENDTDVTNRVIIKTTTYEPQNEYKDNWWLYKPETLDNCVLIPATSRSVVSVDFGRPAFSPLLSNVYMEFVTYIKTVNSNNEVILQKGTGRIYDSFNLTALPLTINYNNSNVLKIHSVSVSLNGLELEIENLSSTLNFALSFVNLKAKPLLESGEVSQIYEVNNLPSDEPRIEQSLESAYYQTGNNPPITRQANAYFKIQAPQYSAELELLGFYPHLNVGGVVNVTLQDTNFNNTKCLIRSASHKIQKQFTTTKIKVSPIVDLANTVSSTITVRVATQTPSTSLDSTPPSVSGQAQVQFDKQKIKIILPPIQ